MTAWYRNTEWNDEIAADFEKRLARSRHQKAQNLSLQGHALIPRHPRVARELLTRAVAFDDPHETPRALAFLALAHLALGDIEGALASYETALERQAAQPNLIAVQPADYLFLIGVFRRAERLAAALPLADTMPDGTLFGPDPQVHAAKALVYDMAGRADEARAHAALALQLMETLPDATALEIDIGRLRRRLEAIASGHGGTDG